MINRIVVAVVVGVVVFLVALLLGIVLKALNVPVLEDVGGFFEQWAVVIGVLGGLLSFFAGWTPFSIRP